MPSYKLVIAMRRDLGMGKGKIAVQAGHASVLAAEQARQSHPERFKTWLDEGQFKVVVRIESERELLDLQGRATEAGLPTRLVRDFGLTQVEANTATCLAIGPSKPEELDRVTGSLQLF